MKEIVIRGYYGFGNLGDDVLMLTSLNITAQVFSEHKQVLCTEHPAPKYLDSMAPGISVINQSKKHRTDIFFHGGGGVHFDFSKGSKTFALLNRTIRTIGYGLFGKVYRQLRKWKGTEGLQFSRQVGVGIGVGTFSHGSRKFYQSVLKLNDYDLLLVRDQGSRRNVESLKLSIPCEVFTDIAFYTEAWKPALRIEKSNSIGIILRDWPYDDHRHIEAIRAQYSDIASLGYPVRFYSFDPSTDQVFIKRMQELGPILQWDPYTMKMADFLNDLGSNQVLVSSRAHGAILGACLGVPGLCLNIEPKLAAVANMLPNGYKLSNFEDVKTELSALISNLDTFNEGVITDLADNRQKINGMLAALGSFAEEIGTTE